MHGFLQKKQWAVQQKYGEMTTKLHNLHNNTLACCEKIVSLPPDKLMETM
jgi:hypothetical protein